MKLVALATLPNGVPAGETFETNAVIGKILLTVGVVRQATDTDSPKVEPPRLKRTYRRRDLRPEE